VESDQAIGTIDPGAANLLLVPGPKGGSSGFAVPPGFPAQGVQYSNNLSKTGGRVDFGQSTHFPISLTVDFWGSLGYSHYSFDEHFPGRPRDSILAITRTQMSTSSGCVSAWDLAKISLCKAG
jgi:hypothetical protein